MSNSRFNILLPLIIAVSICIGIVVGNIFNIHSNRGSGRGFNKINSVLELINRNYVDTVDINQIVEDAMPEIIAQLDPHSAYIPASDAERVKEDLEGSFSGIGVQFNIKNDTILVVGVINGGPSEKLGILPGDKIVEVNDSTFVGTINEEQVLKKLKGKKGTQVKVGVKRQGVKDLLEFDITRGDIPVTSIDASYLVNGNTGYVKVNKFAATTHKEFRNAIVQLQQEGATQLILDFRSNGGGRMDAAVKMVNEFLPENRLIVYTKGKAYPQENYFSDGTGSSKGVKIAVLIDEWSASASEIFAGAIQDNDRGVIIGRRSYGKGLVQTDIPFPDSSAVRLTIARYYTPSGRYVQKPYSRGHDEEYEKDLLNRLNHGELFEKDSIKVTDSIEYRTIGGRIVYGGGGIIPDIFVPRDTSFSSSYFVKLVNYGTIYQYSIDYTDKNREKLKQYKTRDELLGYIRSQNLLMDLFNFAEKKGIRKSAFGLKKSEPLIMNRLEAYIVKIMLTDNDFYQVVNAEDPTMLKAIEALNEGI